MYCDGLCPVFPALAGGAGDPAYLGNLCHNCRACWRACQYAPPHPFAINAPAVFLRARLDSYADHVWPRFLRPALLRPALGAGFMLAAALASFSVLLAASDLKAARFYAVAPESLMVFLAAASLAWATLSLTASTLRYWRSISTDLAPGALTPALRRTAADIITLKHLDGGGPGCHDIGPGFSRLRRWAHQLMAAGVLLAFASTLAAALFQHVLGLEPPFAPASAPVLLGAGGGLAIVFGAAGLLAIEAFSERAPSERGESQLNVSFLIALELLALSGLALLAGRDTPAMGALLVVHLSLVIGFFVGLPASKALHAPFRAAALFRAALDRRRPRRAGATE
jgi:citrate/tricarballylate utilization protein